MAKKTVKTVNVADLNKDSIVDNVVVTDLPAQPKYGIGKLPRNGLNEGTKHGQGGTAGTYKAVCAALADGPLTIDQLRAVCKDAGDPGFARYAVRNHWLLPVEAK